MVALMLLVLNAGWADFPDPPASVTKGKPPKQSQRREALDELQGLLGQWQKERLEFAREQRLQTKAEDRVEASKVTASDDKGGSAAQPTIEIKKGAKGRGKVLEFAPKSKLDGEVEEAEAEAEAHRAECAKNPARCAADKQKRDKREAANDAFEDAVEVGFEKRRKSIEAEAAKIQAELDVAKKREANRQAKKLGGSVDDEGNFADDDLKADPDPRKSF